MILVVSKTCLLEVSHVETYYGDRHILFDLSLEAGEGEVVCLLGRNGAGKTTTVRSIIGLTPPRTGCVTFRGQDLVGLAPFRIARLGVGFVPEDRRVFGHLTVRENLEVARRTWSAGGAGPWTEERLFDLFPILRGRRGQLAGTLSGGEQQRLTVARTLMGSPHLLLLDEPSEGGSGAPGRRDAPGAAGAPQGDRPDDGARRAEPPLL